MIIIRVFSLQHMFCVRKTNVSGRRFFYAPKTYNFVDCYLSSSKIGPILWTHCVRNLFLISEYFEKSELEFSKFYCIFGSLYKLIHVQDLPYITINMGPDQTATLGSWFIVFDPMMKHLNIWTLAADVVISRHFLDKRYWRDKGRWYFSD